MTYVGRTVTFIDEGIERTGIVQRVAYTTGSMLVNITDGIDDTKQIIVDGATLVRIVLPSKVTKPK